MKRRSLRVKWIVLAAGCALAIGAFFAWPDDEDAVNETISTLFVYQRALEMYSRAHHRYPATTSPEALLRQLSDQYIPEPMMRLKHHLKPVDGWGRRLRVDVRPQRYVIWSAGSDGEPDDPSPLGLTKVVDTHSARQDLVLRNHDFIQRPAGAMLGDIDWFTMLDEQDNPENTGVLRLDFEEGHRGYGRLQLMRSGLVMIEKDLPVSLEVPPGAYQARLAGDCSKYARQRLSGQYVDLPDIVVVRHRIEDQLLRRPFQELYVSAVRPGPRRELVDLDARPLEIEIWSGDKRLCSGETNQLIVNLLPGTYVARAVVGQQEYEHPFEVALQDGYNTVDVDIQTR